MKFLVFPVPALSAGEVEFSTRGALVCGSREQAFSGVSIDTRTIREGNIFFAICGPNQDGHRFIPDALSKGALGAVVRKGYAYPGEFPAGRVLIEVENTHEALKNSAAAVRQRWPGKVVAITGSMGKTTTKQFAAHAMQIAFKVHQSPGNYNNLFGLPLALFGLSPDDDFGIFEMGMSARGEIAEMCRIATPDIGIITNVAPVHLEFFHSIEQIACAKEELAEALGPEGSLIYNIDDPLVRGIAGRFEGSLTSYGFSEAADVHAGRIEILSPEETRFRITCSGETRYASIPFAGPHYVMNALAAIALGIRHGIELERLVDCLRQLPHPSMRGRILRFLEGFTLIDDSYNSNPRALKLMIEVLSKMPSFTRRILVAGEMLELGDRSASLHFECGMFAANHGLDAVIGVQGAAQEIVRASTKGGMMESQAHFFSDVDAASAFLKNEVRKGDLILIKGSRGVHMERIVQFFRSHYEEGYL
jgi:UDP-N-acetylmuramoyl-tripeptide--D-alanyl-D-alanine ligase